MPNSDALYTGSRKMSGIFKEDIAGVGDAAFSGPAGPLQYFITFKKGKGSGSAATFMNLKARGTHLSMDVVKKVAQQIAAGM